MPGGVTGYGCGRIFREAEVGYLDCLGLETLKIQSRPGILQHAEGNGNSNPPPGITWNEETIESRGFGTETPLP